MLRVPNHSQGPIHYEWTPAELIRTNDSVLVSVIEALLTEAHIPFLVTDRNMSALAGSIEAFPLRVIVGDCCVSNARRLLEEAGYGQELLRDQSREVPPASSSGRTSRHRTRGPRSA